MSDKITNRIVPAWLPPSLSPAMQQARERARLKYEHEQQVLRSMGRKIIARCLGLPQ